VPSWLLKAAAQRLVSVLPYPHYWNELFQTRITGSLNLDPDEFERKRITDHRLAMRNSSFRIVDEQVQIRGNPGDLARVRLAWRRPLAKINGICPKVIAGIASRQVSFHELDSLRLKDRDFRLRIR
jgi:hypothetical protein